MNNDKSKMIKKIEKLLNLSKRNSSPHESAVALRQAQLLMKKYDVTEYDIDFAKIEQASTLQSPSDANSPPQYLTALIASVNKAIGTQAYLSWNIKGKRIVVFYGFGERPTIAAYVFDVLSEQLKRSVQNYLKTLNKKLKIKTRKARADNYRMGFINGIWNELSGFSISDEEKSVLDNWLIKQEFSQVSVRETKTGNGIDKARMIGFMDGSQVKIARGLQDRSEPELIGVSHV